MLSYIIRHAIRNDVAGTASDTNFMMAYADTAVAFLDAAGMASWAHTVSEEDYTLDRFALVVPITEEEYRRWDEQVRRAKEPPAA